MGAVQLGQTLAQPAAIDSRQWRHVSNGADAEQIKSCAQSLGMAQLPGKGRRQHMGQADTSQTLVWGASWGQGRMQQGQHRRTLLRDGVVIRDDHLHPKRFGTLKRLPGADAVVNGHQQLDAISGQPLDHAGIEPIALALATGDGRLRASPEALQHPQQQGRAGHAIGVVVAADRHPLGALAGLDQTIYSKR